MNERDDQHAGGGPVSGARLCPACGKPLQATDKFCIFCGATVMPEQPVPAAALLAQPETRGKAGFFGSPAGIVLIVALALLIVGGVTVGLILALRGTGNKEAREKATKAIDQAIEDLSKVAKDIESTDERLASVDLETLGQAEAQAGEMEDELGKASDSLSEIKKDLKDVEPEELLPWQKECISLLFKAEGEYGKAVQEMEDLLKRAQDIGEFKAAIDQAVNDFEAAIISQNQAALQYREAQHAVAGSTAQTACEQLDQARDNLQRASDLESDADLSDQLANIDNAEKAIGTFRQMCDAMTSGDTALESTLSEQFKAETAAVSSDLTFDYESYFAGELDEELDGDLASIAEHIDKAAGFMKKAEKERSENKETGSGRQGVVVLNL